MAGADRREAPGPKPVRLGRRLRLRASHPDPGSSGMVEFSEESPISFESSDIAHDGQGEASADHWPPRTELGINGLKSWNCM